MTLKIRLSEPVHRCGCDRCGLTDPEGGVLLEDDTEARRVFCRACTMELLVACLTRTRSIAPASLLLTDAPCPGRAGGRP
jgi:hypothetical protein